MTTRFVTPETDRAEWDAAWAGLLRKTRDADTVMKHPMNGECWQYMGSELHGDGWLHSFRHRWHPANNRRRYEWVRASAGWAS